MMFKALAVNYNSAYKVSDNAERLAFHTYILKRPKILHEFIIYEQIYLALYLTRIEALFESDKLIYIKILKIVCIYRLATRKLTKSEI